MKIFEFLKNISMLLTIKKHFLMFHLVNLFNACKIKLVPDFCSYILQIIAFGKAFYTKYTFFTKYTFLAVICRPYNGCRFFFFCFLGMFLSYRNLTNEHLNGLINMLN